MKHRIFSDIAFILLFASAILLLGCSAPLELGPKPEIYGIAANSWQSQTVDEFRDWLIKLAPKSAATLKKTGAVSFTFAELQSNDPAHAELIANYGRVLDDRQAKANGLIFRSTPEGITFRADKDIYDKVIPGQYSVEIRFVDGNKSILALSYPFGANS